MGSLTANQHVDAPVDVVFQEAIDLAHAAERFSAIDRVETLTPAPFGAGTRWRETRTMFGRPSTEELEVIEFDPPHSYTVACESCGCVYHSTLRFTPSGDGTEVSMEITHQAVSLLAKLMSPLSACMMGGMKKALQQDLTDLKKAAESHARVH